MWTASRSTGRKAACLLALLALLAGPASAASEDQVADVTVSWLETRGDVRGQGDLAFIWTLVQPGSLALDGALLRAPEVGFLLETVERDVKLADLAGVRSDPEPDFERGQWANATVRFSEVDPGAYMLVVATGANAAWSGSASTLEPMAAEVREPSKARDLQPSLTASGGSGIQLTGDLGALDVRGAFTVALWGVEVVVTHNGAERTIRSGYGAGSTGQDVDVADQSWLYLSTTNGSLMLQPGEVPPATIHLAGEEVSFSTNGLVQAHGIGGTFLGKEVTPGASLWATGRLDGHVASDGEILAATWDGDVDHAAMGGAALEAPQSGLGWWLLALATAIVAVTAAVATVLRRRVGDPLERLLARGHFDRVGRRAARRLQVHDDARTRCALAVSLIRQGKAAEALKAVGGGGIHPATKAFLEAQAYAMLGDEATARARLAHVLALAPHLREHARRNPVLGSLMATDGAAYA